MRNITIKSSRRTFIKTTTNIAVGISGLTFIPHCGFGKDTPPDGGIHIIGPKEGFSPQVGTLVSMLNWMQSVVLQSVTNMTKETLDYLHDPESNTIGAMLLHLAATETFYQGNTFAGRNEFTDKEKAQWGAAMNLGDEGRKQIKGNDLDYYLSILEETREKTLSEFRKRDDKWLLKVDPKFFAGQPTNNYCKWFHVCEHESNHNGQIKWIKSRLPVATEGND